VHSKILVVDDDIEIGAAIAAALEVEGYEVKVAPDGLRALTDVAAWTPDAMVLDVLMPGLDGLAVCRRLRALGDRLPILMVTARDAIADRVDGLDAGADDYLVKPFDVHELLARLRALVRRAYPAAEAPEVLSYADLTVDPASRTGRRHGRPLEFSATELTLLELFLENPGRVLSRDIIMDRVWGQDFGPATNSLEVYVGYLRRKLEAAGESRLIHTVRGIGYRLDAP
jgi:two-component system response regulator MprA